MEQRNYSELNEVQMEQYRNSITSAFPEIIFKSQAITEYWERLEKYFPDYQLILLDPKGDIIGSINMVPIFWDKTLPELPDDGWDWMLKKGVTDFENQIKPNTLGGLQVIVRKDYLGKGYSKLLIEVGKLRMEEAGFSNLIIPIRPTFKHKHPRMKMTEYMQMKNGDVIYDPWIRTHLKSGAQVIKVCTNSMTISGDVSYWEQVMQQKISVSGDYLVTGALNPVHISLEDNEGVYIEENIWIKYTQ